jgi:hypothetical protein
MRADAFSGHHYPEWLRVLPTLTLDETALACVAIIQERAHTSQCQASAARR